MNQPLRRSTRLNQELELRGSEYLKQQVATGIKNYDDEVMLAMTSIASQIIDPQTVEAAKKLEGWPEWQALIENELDIHKRLRTRELVTPPLNANIVGSQIVLCYKLGKDGSISS